MRHLAYWRMTKLSEHFVLALHKSVALEIVVLVELPHELLDLVAGENVTKLSGKGFLDINERMVAIEVAQNKVGGIRYQQWHAGKIERVTDINSGIPLHFHGD